MFIKKMPLSLSSFAYSPHYNAEECDYHIKHHKFKKKSPFYIYYICFYGCDCVHTHKNDE